MLHGSRATGHAHAGSDWDLGVLGGAGLDLDGLRVALTEALGTDDVDLVDLAHATALLRFEAARGGRCVFERQPGAFEAFVLEATLFWCDIEPVLRRAHADVLDRLPS